MFVKICGITRAQDADLAAELGADALGFVFWPGSPRHVAEGLAREIVRRHTGRVKTVGVFVDQPLDIVASTMDRVGLDMAQLHGAETPEYCVQLGRPVIKAISLRDDGTIALDGFDAGTMLLIDAHDPVRHGGTGRTVDWNAARQIAASRDAILAGGLTADNIARAVETVRPYGVDVSSGVEASPGVKDATRLRLFFEALNG